MDIGAPELLIILAIALLIFGSNKLPKLARSLGQASKEFKAATSDNWGEETGKSHAPPTEAAPAPASPAEATPAEAAPAQPATASTPHAGEPAPAAEPPNGAAPSAAGSSAQ